MLAENTRQIQSGVTKTLNSAPRIMTYQLPWLNQIGWDTDTSNVDLDQQAETLFMWLVWKLPDGVYNRLRQLIIGKKLLQKPTYRAEQEDYLNWQLEEKH